MLLMSRPCRPWPGPGVYGAFPFDLQSPHEVFKHGRVPALARPQEQDQGAHVAVNQSMDLGGQPAPGAADGVIIRLIKQIHVIREVPLCGGEDSCRAGGHGSPWSPPTPPNQSTQPRRHGSTTQPAPCPRYRAALLRRWCFHTVFHDPKWEGRSRHGIPAR